MELLLLLLHHSYCDEACADVLMTPQPFLQACTVLEMPGSLIQAAIRAFNDTESASQSWMDIQRSAQQGSVPCALLWSERAKQTGLAVARRRSGRPSQGQDISMMMVMVTRPVATLRRAMAVTIRGVSW